MEDERPACFQQLPLIRQQASLHSIVAVRTRIDQTHQMTAGMKQAIRGVEEGAEGGIGLPGQADIAALRLDRHQGKGDPQGIGDLPMRPRTIISASLLLGSSLSRYSSPANSAWSFFSP